ncbi:macrolide ABC transporter ATP-binding protein [Hahella sp. CCB-MM4]|uniref:ABC transporter ATP-binding protein n=1 Tax=Hahella sp. (strain CCB-MM4) TaxID=1926491 RepID=UPI000B9BC3FA|nr:ABC transporter ATP-binding protein [Hahella sp. CCB-MM4]OZG71082.1 macrolide ABC transporter ATP-binding protein [Hahella sp. CCB-MM4]
MSTILECKHLTKQYHQGDTTVNALQGVDVSFNKGEFVSISGPSGSGKSTLLHIIGSLEQPTDGDVILDGISLRNESRRELADIRLNRIGFVFQAYNLIPVLTAAENVEFILQLQGVDRQARRARSGELLKQVGLEGLENRRPGQLSGGQQQRVAVARALASHPAIVLADEPTANLDSKNSDELLALMSKLNQESNVTIIVATHDPKVIAHTRRHIVLTDGNIETDETRAA